VIGIIIKIVAKSSDQIGFAWPLPMSGLLLDRSNIICCPVADRDWIVLGS